MRIWYLLKTLSSVGIFFPSKGLKWNLQLVEGYMMVFWFFIFIWVQWGVEYYIDLRHIFGNSSLLEWTYLFRWNYRMRLDWETATICRIPMRLLRLSAQARKIVWCRNKYKICSILYFSRIKGNTIFLGNMYPMLKELTHQFSGQQKHWS